MRIASISIVRAVAWIGRVMCQQPSPKRKIYKYAKYVTTESSVQR